LMLNDTHWLKFSQAMALPQDDSLATLRQRKKARERVEALVKDAIAAQSFESVAARLKAAGVGFTEVLPLERVLEAPQARHPGKLRKVRFRDFQFDVPEFPRLHADQEQAATQPPPALGEHTAAVLKSAGVSEAEFQSMLKANVIAEASPTAFAWAPVRREA